MRPGYYYTAFQSTSHLMVNQILQNSKNCHNCDQFKARLQDQQELFSRRVRELETCIQDLATEKEALEQKLYNQRRSSEEFTSRVQQMVQKLEIEQRVQKKEKRETGGKTRETENFFSMVKRFFTEHEPMKNHAQVCLRDLRQIQQCFQVGVNFQFRTHTC